MTEDKQINNQLNELVVANIFHLMEYRNWTIKTLSDNAGVPYETLKKILSLKIKKPSFSEIVKISIALDCSIDYLLNQCPQNLSITDNLPLHLHSRLQYLSTFTNLQKIDECLDMTHMIPIYTPCRNNTFELHTDFDRLDLLDVRNYHKPINFAIRITNNFYHPVFFHNDILLCSCDRPPHFGEIGIFLHKNKLYIRQFLPNKNYVLAPVNGVGYPIILNSLDDWLVYGYVVTIYDKS